MTQAEVNAIREAALTLRARTLRASEQTENDAAGEALDSAWLALGEALRSLDQAAEAL